MFQIIRYDLCRNILIMIVPACIPCHRSALRLSDVHFLKVGVKYLILASGKLYEIKRIPLPGDLHARTVLFN